ncbi:ammonium transporter [Gloeobacter kilaueensis]|uniref:Ammonium transporter n=1 Tax=Gloeobacter kilaueensis (strain ATCC BAA-2537 / CCAP 1431/1 / ULC 316 / JS1) TaxID=1183438 RepID=U5QLB5_GLOK1|nr:ammonium transporter [Gloeobacter kilaueensis]AGY59678.1 ammonium transporter [Gloeobacter kilaueensis JS1]
MNRITKGSLSALAALLVAAPVYAADGPKIDTGDTAWLLISSALVLLMTPGLAFFYGGLVRGKNALNTLMMSIVALGVIALVWTVVGYSLAFAPGSGLLGGFAWLGLNGVNTDPSETYATTTPHLAFMVFQMMFAIITPALISGAIVDRMKFKTYVVFIMLWSVVVYSPVAHWVWSLGNPAGSEKVAGWIGALGALDFAGGTVVHFTAGVSALVAALIIGPRRGFPNQPMPPHNVPFVLLGASLLWFGWFGFNAGSATAANGTAALAFVTTNVATAAAMSTWLLLETLLNGKPSAVGAATGAVVGLVAITPACAYISPLSAIALGGIAAIISYGAIQLKKKFGYDDSLDVFACHGLGGFTGAVLTGVFCAKAVGAPADGLIAGNPGQVVTQLIAVGATGLYAAAATAVILLALKFTLGLKASEQAELEGLDISEHGEEAYLGLAGSFGSAIEEGVVTSSQGFTQAATQQQE